MDCADNLADKRSEAKQEMADISRHAELAEIFQSCDSSELIGARIPSTMATMLWIQLS